MNIIVTGGSGTLGNAIRKAGKRMGISIIAPTHSELDIENFESCRLGLREYTSNDVIIHCAAITDWTLCHREPHLCFSTNAVGAWHISKVAKEREILLIHISTDSVFSGDLKAGGYTEEDQPKNPVSVYGISKMAAENLVYESGCRLLLVRVGWFFGASPEDDPKFIGAILRQASEGNPIKAVDDKYGTLAYTPQVAERILMYAVNQVEGIRHLANEGIVNRFNIAEHVLKLWGYSTPPQKVPSSAFPSPVQRPAFAALRTIYEDAKLPTWKEALAEYHSTYKHLMKPRGE